MSENKAEQDQDLANIRDSLPALYWAIYKGCIEKGFENQQALQIVLATILSQGKAPVVLPATPVAGKDESGE